MIPHIVHHICEPLSETQWMPIWRPCYNSWIKNFPDHRHFKWSNHRINVFVKEVYPKYLNFFSSLPFDIMRYDISRYLILHHYGGIYADMDSYVYKNFQNLLDQELHIVQHTGNIVTTNNEIEIVSNWLICSVPKNDFFLKCVELSFDRIKKHIEAFGLEKLLKDKMHQILYLTGPFIVGQVFIDKNYDAKNILSAKVFTSNHFLYDINMFVKHIGTASWTGWEPGKNMVRDGHEYLTEDFDFYQSAKIIYDP